MGRTNTVDLLPSIVRKEIDERLMANGFSDYLGLEQELRGRGYSKVSKSALHRYGLALKRRIKVAQATAQLQAAGIDAEMAAELSGDATLVVVIDRRNGRARLISLPMPAATVIGQIKRLRMDHEKD